MHRQLALACALAACAPEPTDRVQGYVEGELVYVAAPLAGALETLSVRRGAEVGAGDPLFALDEDPERARRDEARHELERARSLLADAEKGARPSEITAIEAQLELARAALEFSEATFERRQDLEANEVVTLQELDLARSERDQDKDRVAQLEAELETARLGARPDEIEAAAAEVKALEAALARAEWDLAQKSQRAPKSGLVFDTLYRAGEWVEAGKPVVALLPPENIRVRAYVPEERIGSLRIGQTARVLVDGVAEPSAGTLSFLSPRAEYTPPVIYSRESRAKLVFLIEVTFEPAVAARLHPGQPVDVELGP
jgi:HlyD family secretion protein